MEQYKKFYHISPIEYDIITEFKPRIPKDNIRLDDEESTIPRICVSTSINGCVNGSPYFSDTIMYTKNSFDQCMPMRVYEFDCSDILDANIIFSDKLYELDYVRDAKFTGECWVINQSLKPSNVYYIQITDCSMDYHLNISYEDLKKCNLETEDYYDGSYKNVSKEQEELLKKFSGNSEFRGVEIFDYKKILLDLFQFGYSFYFDVPKLYDYDIQNEKLKKIIEECIYSVYILGEIEIDEIILRPETKSVTVLVDAPSSVCIETELFINTLTDTLNEKF